MNANIRRLENVMRRGRKLELIIDFSRDDENEPVVDWFVLENGTPIAFGLHRHSVEAALEEIDKAVGVTEAKV